MYFDLGWIYLDTEQIIRVYLDTEQIIRVYLDLGRNYQITEIDTKQTY